MTMGIIFYWLRPTLLLWWHHRAGIQLKEGRANIVCLARITLLFSVIGDLNKRGGHSTSLIVLLLRAVSPH